MLVHHMAITVLDGSRVVSLSAPGRGTAATGDGDGTEPGGAEGMGPGGMAEAITAAEGMATTDAADTRIAAVLPARRSAAASAEVLPGVVSTAVDAGSSTAIRSAENRNGWQIMPAVLAFVDIPVNRL